MSQELLRAPVGTPPEDSIGVCQHVIDGAEAEIVIPTGEQTKEFCPMGVVLCEACANAEDWKAHLVVLLKDQVEFREA